MSIIGRLDDKLSNLPDILDEYDNTLSDYKTNLVLKGKSLREANSEQPAWLSFYDEQRIELKTLVEFLEVKINYLKGKRWKQMTEDHKLDLSSTDKSKYADADPTTVKLHTLLLETKEVYHKYIVVVDAFQARGYALKNLTDLYVHSIPDVTI